MSKRCASGPSNRPVSSGPPSVGVATAPDREVSLGDLQNFLPARFHWHCGCCERKRLCGSQKRSRTSRLVLHSLAGKIMLWKLNTRELLMPIFKNSIFKEIEWEERELFSRSRSRQHVMAIMADGWPYIPFSPTPHHPQRVPTISIAEMRKPNLNGPERPSQSQGFVDFLFASPTWGGSPGHSK